MKNDFKIEYVKRVATYYMIIRENNKTRKVVSVSRISEAEYLRHAK